MKNGKFWAGGLVLAATIGITAAAAGQGRRDYFPIWTFHQDSIHIHGVAVGIASIANGQMQVNINGLKVEIIGVGLGTPLIPRSPVAKDDDELAALMATPFSERINGAVISASGTVCWCLTNGVVVGLIGHINQQINGVSAAGYLNFAQVHNGVQVSLFNDSYLMRGLQAGFGNHAHRASGLQVGIVNRSEALRGLQIGLWNVSERRKLPFFNWGS